MDCPHEDQLYPRDKSRQDELFLPLPPQGLMLISKSSGKTADQLSFPTILTVFGLMLIKNALL